jgi:hypothetical protein
MIRRTLLAASAALAVTLLAGCPDSSTAPLGKPGEEKIDKKLVGTWKCTDPKHDLQRIRINQQDKFSYKVEILDKGPGLAGQDVAPVEAWATKVGKQKFLYGRTSPSSYYTYGYAVKGKSLRLSSLDVTGSEMTSTEIFRSLVTDRLSRGTLFAGTSEFLKE